MIFVKTFLRPKLSFFEGRGAFLFFVRPLPTINVTLKLFEGRGGAFQDFGHFLFSNYQGYHFYFFVIKPLHKDKAFAESSFLLSTDQYRIFYFLDHSRSQRSTPLLYQSSR